MVYVLEAGSRTMLIAVIAWMQLVKGAVISVAITVGLLAVGFLFLTM